MIDVLCLTPFFPPMVSGAAEYLSDVAAGLTGDGHRVHVVTSQGTAGLTTRDGVVVRSVRARGRGLSSLRMVAAAVAEHRRSRFDVVVAGAAYPNGVVAALVAALIRRPLVVIAYGEDVSVARRSRIALLCLRRVWRAAHAVIAISSFTRDEIVTQGAGAARCHLVPPGIGPGPFDATGPTQRSAFRQRHQLSGPTLLTVARLEERKGHDVVLGAIAQLAAEIPALEYVIVGSGDQAIVRTLARRYGIEERLTILDHLDQQQLAEAYAGADVYVMMSRMASDGEVEGFGIVYLEAAASGLPCIAGDQGGAPDAVLHDVTGFCVDPEDTAAVARAIRLLVDRPDLARTMGAAGRDRVRSQFTRGEMQAQTTAHIVAAGVRRRRRPLTAGAPGRVELDRRLSLRYIVERAERTSRGRARAWHASGRSRVRLSAIVDQELLALARSAFAGETDSVVVNEALRALLARQRAAQIDQAYSASDERPTHERDEDGDHRPVRRR